MLADGSEIIGVSGVPAFIQSSFGGRGNLELVIPLLSGGLGYYFRDNDDPSLSWHRGNDGNSIATQTVLDSVSLIQSTFGGAMKRHGLYFPAIT